MSKIDWSTPYDSWLIPLLNRARYSGAIEFRALPSQVQLQIEETRKQDKTYINQLEQFINDAGLPIEQVGIDMLATPPNHISEAEGV